MTPERYQKVGAIFDAAIKLKAEDRPSYLATACGGDETLKKEVESLLSYDSQTGNFLDNPAVQLGGTHSSKPRPALSNEQVNHYKILSLLGRGGMGEVYRARDTRLDRDVALKILPAVYSSDAERLSRFEQEARAAGRLNHPNVLTVYDVGVYQSSPYIVTELLDGQELRTQLNHGALSHRRALQYAHEIATGLAAAHAKGIVHRDLKPENIFITNDVGSPGTELEFAL